MFALLQRVLPLLVMVAFLRRALLLRGDVLGAYDQYFVEGVFETHVSGRSQVVSVICAVLAAQSFFVRI